MLSYKSTTACHTYIQGQNEDDMISLPGPHPENSGLTQQAMTTEQSDFSAT